MAEAEPPSTFPALFAQVAAARKNHDAVATLAETVTYAELDRRSAEMARALMAAGAGKGARIALLAPDGIFWAVAFLACTRIGALVTLVSTLCAPRELAHIIRHSDTQFLLSARRFLRHDYGRDMEVAFPGLEGQQHGALRLQDAPYLRAAWFDDPEGLSWARDFSALLEHAGEIGPEILKAAEAQVTPSEDAVIVYTSGSTSQPKAVVHSQWNISRHPPELAKLFLIKPEDRMLPMLPVFWLGGLAMATQVLSQGATLVYPATPDIEIVFETMQKLQVNRVNGWGDGLTRLGQLAKSRGVDIDAIIGLGQFREPDGTPIPPAQQTKLLGMSETFAPHSGERLDFKIAADKPNASGRPVNNYERRVVDPETGEIKGPGEAGELQLRGGALMSGLYKKRRSDVFTPDGFYPTGDLVTIDADDYLTFVARRSDMIKTRAANVSRLEVEAALNELPEVKISVVTGLPDAEFGQIVGAAVVPEPGTTPDAESLRLRLRDSLSSYKVPRRIVFIREDEIPRTATGKLKLHELEQLIASKSG